MFYIHLMLVNVTKTTLQWTLWCIAQIPLQDWFFPQLQGTLLLTLSSWPSSALPQLKRVTSPKVMSPSQGNPHPMTGWYKCIKVHPLHPTWDNSAWPWPWPSQSFIWRWLRLWLRLHHSPAFILSLLQVAIRKSTPPINLLVNLHLTVCFSGNSNLWHAHL